MESIYLLIILISYSDKDGLIVPTSNKNERLVRYDIFTRRSLVLSTKPFHTPDPNHQSAASRFSTSLVENVATNDASPADGKFSNLDFLYLEKLIHIFCQNPCANNMKYLLQALTTGYLLQYQYLWFYLF